MPSAHIADRMTALYAQEMFGAQIAVVSDGRAIAAALPDVRPTVWGAVPRVWEKLKAGIEFTAGDEPDEAKRQAMQRAFAVAAKRADSVLAGESIRNLREVLKTSLYRYLGQPQWSSGIQRSTRFETLGP